jgi:Membrane bound O-acyl transferase family
VTLTLLEASLLTLLAVAIINAVQITIWPWRSLRRVVVALAVLLNVVAYWAMWETPGFVAVALAMAAAGHLVRITDAVLGFPEATRKQFALFLGFLIRHPTRDRRFEPSADPRLRFARGLVLHVVVVGLFVLGNRLRLWTWAPYLDDLWMAAELGCFYLAWVELLSPLARRLGIREFLLCVDGLAVDFAWSPSLRVFWGSRWNLPVSNLLRRAFFVPLGGGRRIVRATLVVFLVSGLMHAVPLLVGGEDRVLWAWLAVGALVFFLVHGLVVLGEGAMPRWLRRRGSLGRVVVYATFLLTLPLYPAPLFVLIGVHGRPVESLTPVVIARALGL